MVTTKEDLASLTCVPCRGGVPPLGGEKIKLMLEVVPGWSKSKGEIDKIEKTFKFRNFTEAMDFVNKVAEVAEEQGHHPDIFIQWNKVTLTLWTHAIKGLFDNDFILAAKIDEL